MEMHQIRYFLGVARTLNFTRAAEECHVAQPSLTRAIKLLEDELGGELFRRERNLSHLTELGQRMLPLMQQCYESALGAKLLATSIKRGEIASLRIALSRSVDLAVLVPYLNELVRALNGLELKFVRGTAPEVAEIMKQGQADLAVSGALAEAWERFDAWPLFEERFMLVVREDHWLASRTSATLDEIRGEHLLQRSYCEHNEQVGNLLRGHDSTGAHNHDVACEHDLITLLEGGIGIGIVPKSLPLPQTLRRVPLPQLEITRTVYLYAVAGRQRTSAAAVFVKQLQAADWSALTP
jgi:DNA-binding transcriptional LysR family regulator